MSASDPTGPVRRARLAVYAIFALAGVQFAAFAARIPDLKRTLDLSAGEVGLTLLALSAGSLLGLPAAGWVTHRFGAARSVAFGLVTSAIGLILVGVGVDLATARPIVMAGLFLAGLGIGLWDVAMNLEGVTVERQLGYAIMPRFHAAFSGGTVASALLGAALSARSATVLAHLAGVVVVSAVSGLIALRHFLPSVQDDGEAAQEHGAARQGHAAGPDLAGPDPGVTGQSSSLPTGQAVVIRAQDAWREPRTLLIGLVTLAAAFTEGTANDWMAVAMVEGHGMPAWAGVLGFAAFLTAMTVGRIAGTTLLATYGRVPLLRWLFAMAIAGAILVVFGSPTLAFLGAILWGLGASLGFPVGMSAAADDPARAPSRISVVSTIGYLAFLAGPPLLGLVGDRVGVLRALLAVVVLLVVALLAVPALREPALARRSADR